MSESSRSSYGRGSEGSAWPAKVRGGAARRIRVALAALALLAAAAACVPAATETPTEWAAPGDTATPTELSGENPSPTSTATVASPVDGLAILSFSVDVQDIATGKRLAFEWETTGAVGVVIWSGTRMRFPDAWSGPANGTLTVEVSSTYYRDPSVFLEASDADDDKVQSDPITIPWPCEHDYFFETDMTLCAAAAAIDSAAAEQLFEHGRMLWLEDATSGGDVVPRILVLYDDAPSRYEDYPDTWTDAEPESDPNLVPPAGLYQPTRGFGKVWRETSAVRDALGWAL
ncbi:MAG: hypothetical protein E3J64_06800, partial [Anaerolineales bacterium]